VYDVCDLVCPKDRLQSLDYNPFSQCGSLCAAAYSCLLHQEGHADVGQGCHKPFALRSIRHHVRYEESHQLDEPKVSPCVPRLAESAQGECSEYTHCALYTDMHIAYLCEANNGICVSLDYALVVCFSM
jgi:hypothetical protein